MHRQMDGQTDTPPMSRSSTAERDKERDKNHHLIGVSNNVGVVSSFCVN